MKKAILIFFIGLGLYSTAMAQTTKKAAPKKETAKKESQSDTDARHERHKAYWKKFGNDQKEFWKEEHERHVENKEADKKSTASKKSENVERSGPKKPPPPRNPFKKKNKETTE